MSRATYHVGDTRDVIAAMPDGSVDLVLTSPPFLALRSYLPADHPDKGREIGSEPDPAAFVDMLLGLTAEWRRVLAPHGSLAVELGDTYSGSGGAGGDYGEGGLREGQARFQGSAERNRPGYGGFATANRSGASGGPGWPLPKCLALVPELYRVGLAYGRNPLTGSESPAGRWRVRNVVRWVRPNPPVGALGDKFRPATSDMVIACTASDRYFDLDAVRTEGVRDYSKEKPTRGNTRADGHQQTRKNPGQGGFFTTANPAGAPPLDWWQIVPGGYSGSHYAVFPPELCVKPIEAMCPRRVCRTCGKPSRREVENAYEPHGDAGKQNAEPRAIRGASEVGVNGSAQQFANGRADKITTTTGWSSCGCPGTDGIRLDGFHTGTGWRPGIVLDPFAGTGTTLMVATGHGRDAIGIDIDPRNADLARQRMSTDRRIIAEQRRLRQRGSWPRRPTPVRIEWQTGNPVVKPKPSAVIARHHGEQLHLLDALGVA